MFTSACNFFGKTIYAKEMKSKFRPMTGFVHECFLTHGIGKIFGYALSILSCFVLTNKVKTLVYVNLDWAFVDPWMLLRGTEIIQSKAHNHTPHFKMAASLVFFCLLAN